MKLIVGLGNPDPKYGQTRHNVGFALVDEAARTWGAPWQEKQKFKADIAETVQANEKIILAKPTTYYNLSGEAVRAIFDFYKLLPRDVLVVHDELALPFGTLRARLDGSDAGNNGIKNIIAHIGPDFARLRIGTANEQTASTDAADFVLSRFTPEELTSMPKIATHATQLMLHFVRGEAEFANTMKNLHREDR